MTGKDGYTAGGYHVPVLLSESVEALALRPGGVYVDATFGGGGHSRAILSRLTGGAVLFGFDQDPDAAANAPALCPGDGGSFTFVASNFRYLRNWMRYYGVGGIDGIIADLGVSSHHLDDAGRGFSFRFDAPLDMRMNRLGGITAKDIVESYPEERLADVLYNYGELRNSRRIASAIVKARAEGGVSTTAGLVSVVEPLLPRERSRKELSKVFQALRIEVNGEMAALSELLEAATDLLVPGGRLVFISYHSMEDRMVKNFIKAGNASGRAESDFYGRVEKPLRAIGGVVAPSEEEQFANPRSRSAKMRVGEKI